MTSQTCDVIVIGCGGFGSSALYHLSSRGLSVVGIDRFYPPHSFGSSHGETRLIRKAYFEHPGYVPLLHRAWDLWEDLSDQTSESLNSACSGMTAGIQRSPDSNVFADSHRQERLIQRRDLMMSGPAGSEVIVGARESARLHGLPIENLKAEEANRRYPMFRLPDHHEVIVEASAGFLWSERCISAHLNLAKQQGAVVRGGEVVRSVRGDSRSVTVETDRAVYSASAAVITSGAWTGEVLPDYAKHIRVLRKTLFWYPVADRMWVEPEAAPMFLLDVPEGQFYGPGCVDGATIKVGLHSGGETIQHPSELRRDVSAEEETPTLEFLRKRLNGVAGKRCRSAACMYSMSCDGHFLIDRLTDIPVVVAAGFSGHGFKFTSVMGEIVSDLVQQKLSPFDISFLSANRFQSTSFEEAK